MSYNGYNYSPYYQHQNQQPAVADSHARESPRPTGTSYTRPEYSMENQHDHATAISYHSNSVSQSYNPSYSYHHYNRPSGTDTYNGQPSRGYADVRAQNYPSSSQSYMNIRGLGNVSHGSTVATNSTPAEQVTRGEHPTNATEKSTLSSYTTHSSNSNGRLQPPSNDGGSSGATTSNIGGELPSLHAASIAATALAQNHHQNRLPAYQYHPTNEGFLNRQEHIANVDPRKSSYGKASSPHDNRQSYQSSAGEVLDQTTVHAPVYRSAISHGQQQTSSSTTVGNVYAHSQPPAANVSPAISCETSIRSNSPRDLSSVSRPQGRGSPRTYSYATVTHKSERDKKGDDVPPTEPTRMSVQSPLQPSQPSTVDPSQVFNQYEYQRRKAVAEAKVVKKATESAFQGDQGTAFATEKFTKSQDARNGVSISKTAQETVSNDATRRASSSTDKPLGVESGSKEQIEAEIRAMIEKMREYKAKDPAVFSEVWEQFKKVQPAPRSSSQTPQVNRDSQQTNLSNSIETASPDLAETDHLPSPDHLLVHQDVISKTSHEEFPDLGKFPALRRRRGKIGTGRSRVGHVPRIPFPHTAPIPTTDGTFSLPIAELAAPLDARTSRLTSTQAQSQPNEHSLLEPPADDVLYASKKPEAPAAPAAPNDTMRKAMQTFHASPLLGDTKTTTTKIVMPAPVAQMSSRDVRSQVLKLPYISPYNPDLPARSEQITIWPENKKNVLANIAKNALEAHSENIGKRITAEQIHLILDQNPSYDQLCQILEDRGFKFERRSFARLLLTAVPTKKENPALQDNITPMRDNLESAASDATRINSSMISTSSANTPSRPRGRPRKDGQPPIQRVPQKLDLPRSAGMTSAASKVPNIDGNSLKSLPSDELRKVNGLPNETHRSNTADRPSANISRPLSNHRSSGPGFGMLMLDNSRDLSATGTFRSIQIKNHETPSASRGSPNKDFGWDSTKQNVAESSVGRREKASQANHIFQSVSKPSTLVNGQHSGFGSTDLWRSGNSAGMSNYGQSQQSSHILPQQYSVSVEPHAPLAISMLRTKEEMARKRNFSEIVDLTNESDEGESERHKRIRLEQGIELGSEDRIIHETDDTRGYSVRESGIVEAHLRTIASNIAVKQSQTQQTTQSSGPTIAAPNASSIGLPGFRATDSESGLEREALRTAPVVKAIKEKHALRRSKYDVKTIARDILICKGIHPWEKPLNYHLAPLIRNFSHVIQNSDLSTFNWSLVDPGGPPATEETAEINIDDHDADDEAEYQFPSTVVHSDTLIRRPQVLIEASGDVQTMEIVAEDARNKSKLIPTRGTGRPSRARGTTLIRSFARVTSPPIPTMNNDADLAVVDMISNSIGTRGRPRGRPKSRGISFPRGSLPPLSSGLAPYTTLVGASDDQLSFSGRPLSSNINSGTQPSNLADNHVNPHSSTDISRMGAGATHSGPAEESRSMSGNMLGNAPGSSLVVRVPARIPLPPQSVETPTKRRGRPPGSTNKSSPHKAERSTSTTTISQPRRRGRPPGSKNATPRQPSSLRRTVPEDGIGIILPSRSPSVSSRYVSYVEPTRADSSKRRKHKSNLEATTPAYQIFDCRWKDCHAELHNLETLRKHVFKVHSRTKKTSLEETWSRGIEPDDDSLLCLWQGCGKNEAVQIFDEESLLSKFLDFENEKTWREHIEATHLRPLAWELGDGPSTHPSDVEPSSYLSDAQGRQVTPLARTHGPPDPLPSGSAPSAIRAYHKAHGNVTDAQKAQAVLNSQTAGKNASGMTTLPRDLDSGEDDGSVSEVESEDDSDNEEEA